VEEKFAANCGEATDLTSRLAFEAHHALRRNGETIQLASE
jgi:hypothetical protein